MRQWSTDQGDRIGRVAERIECRMRFLSRCRYGSFPVMLFVCLSLATAGAGNADEVLGPTRVPVLLPETVEQIQSFTVQVEVGRQSEAGYVPLKIRFQSTATFSAERRFVIRVQSEPQLETPRPNGLIMDVPVTVDQSNASQTFIRYLPKWSAGQAISLVVMEDGRPLAGYEVFLGGEAPATTLSPTYQLQRGPRGTRTQRQLLQAEYEWNWLFLSAEDLASPNSLPDLSDLVSPLLDKGGRTNTIQFPESEPSSLPAFWKNALAGQKLHAIGQTELPTDWRAYQRYDVVLMDEQGLERLKSRQPAFEAMRDWVLNGGSVLVYNARTVEGVVEHFGCKRLQDDKLQEMINGWTDDFRSAWQQRRVDADSLFQKLDWASRQRPGSEEERTTSSETSDATTSQGGASDPAMTEIASDNFSGPLLQLQQLQPLEFNELLTRTERTLFKMDEVLNALPSDINDQMEIQPVGAGYLFTIAPINGRQTPTILHWQLMTQFLDARVSPTLRRGVDPILGDSRFRNWMIPGVAQPPVYTFMGLLTVFVILVGPVAYRRTTRYGRGYLMFAIAPVLALLTTIAMFAYGIISDGFGTVARIRQLTWVDGQSGHAGERVRSTYFAGVRPAQGLRFAGDAELFPYLERSGESWDDLEQLPPEMMGKVRIEEQSLRLDASFLPSRQQRQFVQHAPRRDVGFLQLLPAPQDSETREVVSGFDFPIHFAVLRDSKSRYWTVEQLGAGQTKQAKPLVTTEISKTLGKLYNDHRPLSGVRESRSASSRYDNRIYDVILDTNREIDARRTMTDGLFETWLQLQLQTAGELPDEHFVATADVSPDVVAVEESELKSSIRYVFGTLR